MLILFIIFTRPDNSKSRMYTTDIGSSICVEKKQSPFNDGITLISRLKRKFANCGSSSIHNNKKLGEMDVYDYPDSENEIEDYLDLNDETRLSKCVFTKEIDSSMDVDTSLDSCINALINPKTPIQSEALENGISTVGFGSGVVCPM